MNLILKDMAESTEEKYRFVRRHHFECFLIRKKMISFMWGKPSLFYNKELGIGIRISLLGDEFIWELATKKKTV